MICWTTPPLKKDSKWNKLAAGSTCWWSQIMDFSPTFLRLSANNHPWPVTWHDKCEWQQVIFKFSSVRERFIVGLGWWFGALYFDQRKNTKTLINLQTTNEEIIKKTTDSYCWWIRNPAHQLRLVAYPIIYRVLYIPGGAGFLPSTVVLVWQTPMTNSRRSGFTAGRYSRLPRTNPQPLILRCT